MNALKVNFQVNEWKKTLFSLRRKSRFSGSTGKFWGGDVAIQGVARPNSSPNELETDFVE